MKLELQDIRLTFSNSRKGDFHLLQGVDLAVKEGEITAIMGGNGTGKTTLFNIISGLSLIILLFRYSGNFFRPFWRCVSYLTVLYIGPYAAQAL